MIVARIQGHPSRWHLHDALAASLGLQVDVVLHESNPASPWAGYKKCLTDLPDCTHLLVIQDDARVAQNFALALEQIAVSNPDTPVCLYLASMPQAVAAKALRMMKKGGVRYIPLPFVKFVPLVAVLWPRAKAQEFLAWTESGVKLPGWPTPRADDGIVADWMKRTSTKRIKQTVRVCVPSIVDHLHEEPSVKGKPSADGLVRALLFAEDALQYEW